MSRNFIESRFFYRKRWPLKPLHRQVRLRRWAQRTNHLSGYEVERDYERLMEWLNPNWTAMTPSKDTV